ncbi:MAG: hypothetical protein R3330_19610, partial [Saprospiraceae bacterium]|nr:hypothetical protein [Saprospiraceae bacterium]
MKYPDEDIIELSYDREGEDALEADNDPIVTEVLYNGRNQLTQLDLGSGLETTYAYHGSGDNFRLQGISVDSGSILDLEYTYDDVGNVNTIFDDKNGDETLTFVYDHLDRLTSVTGSSYSRSYTYDRLGRFDTFNGVDHDYNDANHEHAVSDLGTGEEFTYDANGNMIGREDASGDYTQEFDYENRLTTVTNTTTISVTQFLYDADGQRMKTVEPDGTVIYTPFPGYEKEVRDGGETIERSYYTLVGQVIAVRIKTSPTADPNDGLYFIHQDHLGSTSVLSDSDGGKKGDYIQHHPFGGYRTEPNPELIDRGFTGHRGNTDIGLIYMNARFYVPSIAQFA